MGVTLNLKLKTENGYTSVRKRGSEEKEIAQLVTTSLREKIAVIAGGAVVQSVLKHNEQVLFKVAMFFQRVVTRTPKDERYHLKTGGYHIPDDDYVWKHWIIRYWGKQVTAEELGEVFFCGDKGIFNDKGTINMLANMIIEKLFGGYDKFFSKRFRIRSIRIENVHPRFAMLEYGGYQCGDTKEPSKGSYWHGVQNGYSVQAPYGMLRITQAEMESMSMTDFDKYMKNFNFYNKNVTRIPSKSKMKRLVKLIEGRTHLSNKDIDAITEVYE